jgi:hypothetical protein
MTDVVEVRAHPDAGHGAWTVHLIDRGGWEKEEALERINNAPQKALTRIKHEVRELLLEHGGGMKSVAFGLVYAKRYGKPLSSRSGRGGEVADLQLRAMTTEIGTKRRTFRNFCEECMTDVVEVRAHPYLGEGAWTVHLLDRGGETEEEAGSRSASGSSSSSPTRDILLRRTRGARTTRTSRPFRLSTASCRASLPISRRLWPSKC